MTIDYVALKAELTTDPNAYGYAPLVAVGSCGELADMLNTVRDNITVPGAKEFFEKETVRVVVKNPRALQATAINAIKGNFGRREMTSLQVSPGTMTS